VVRFGFAALNFQGVVRFGFAALLSFHVYVGALPLLSFVESSSIRSIGGLSP
jgi:hypothetical protein